MNYKIKVNPEQSRKIQEICFSMGIYWELSPNKEECKLTEMPYLYICDDCLAYGDTGKELVRDDNIEIKAEDFIKKYSKEKSVIDMTIKEIEEVIEHNKKLEEELTKANKEIAELTKANSKLSEFAINTTVCVVDELLNSIEEDKLKESGSLNKYSREIKKGVYVDVYDVLKAFQVKNPAVQHAIKKLLASGKRGHKDTIQDLNEAMQSIQRAIELEDE